MKSLRGKGDNKKIYSSSERSESRSSSRQARTISGKYTIAILGSHSALEVCFGAKKQGFRTLVVVEKGRDKTYAEYFKNIVDER